MEALSRFDFSEEEIRALPAGRLLSMEIEFTRKCNYRCPYCYAAEDSAVSADQGISEEMTEEEIRSAIRQASELGARKIVILGGEPLVYPHLNEMIDFISDLGMASEIFTNGGLMTPAQAAFFFSRGCRVVVKLNTFKPEIHDRMTGRKNSLVLALGALEMLRAAGYRHLKKMLGAATVLSSLNIDEAVGMWKFLRDHNIEPYFECITPQGRLLEHRTLLPDHEKVKRVFEEIAVLDEQYGHHWKPQPPLVGQKCFRHCYSCVVESRGTVVPCVGLNEPIGSIREKPLREILLDSMILRKLKNYRKYIKSPCRDCEDFEHCYGCRGAAWQMTGDYLAADPTCWKNASKEKEIAVLPVDARAFIPHKPPVAMVSEIVHIADSGGDIRSVIAEDCVFADEQGVLDNTALIELAAQSVAALNGFMTPRSVPDGMLVEVNRFSCHAPVKTGESVTTRFITATEFLPWHIIEFEILGENGERKAEGVLKLCVPEEV